MERCPRGAEGHGDRPGKGQEGPEGKVVRQARRQKETAVRLERPTGSDHTGPHAHITLPKEWPSPELQAGFRQKLDIVRFSFNNVPSGCHVGGREKMHRWGIPEGFLEGETQVSLGRGKLGWLSGR